MPDVSSLLTVHNARRGRWRARQRASAPFASAPFAGAGAAGRDFR
jgi:hypothetical protein